MLIVSKFLQGRKIYLPFQVLPTTLGTQISNGENREVADTNVMSMRPFQIPLIR